RHSKAPSTLRPQISSQSSLLSRTTPTHTHSHTAAPTHTCTNTAAPPTHTHTLPSAYPLITGRGSKQRGSENHVLRRAGGPGEGRAAPPLLTVPNHSSCEAHSRCPSFIRDNPLYQCQGLLLLLFNYESFIHSQGMKLSTEEFNAIFAFYDKDGNGYIDKNELDALLKDLYEKI
uniref:EF-hand domain-containing protein n=1 Tax=Callorhinchus milii TaxID=7868 RepID=A0A4W3GVW8_CALMI